MAKEIINLKHELHYYRLMFNLTQKIPCSNEENKKYYDMKQSGRTLPDGVFTNEDYPAMFYTVYEQELTEAEKKEYLIYRQLGFLRVIKNCTLFFTILTIISLIVTFIFITNIN